MKALVFLRVIPRLEYKKVLLNRVKKAICELNIALPDKHTKAIYNILDKRDAKILIQLRTGCARCDGAGRRRSNSSITTTCNLLEGNYIKISD